MELRNNQFVFGQLVGTDDRGDQAPLDGTTVEATIDDTDKAEVSLDAEDPTMITVTAKRAGATVLRLKAKAKDVNGDGNVAEFSTEIALQITSGEAVGLGVNFGQPEDQPAAEA